MIHVRIFNVHPKHKIQHRGTIAAARFVVRNEYHGDAEINVVFIDDRKMINLNGLYLDHWHATDVLSFPMKENGKNIEGEVYINLDQARRQAQDYKVSFREEYSRLVIHGVLHLLGYRDKKRQDKLRITEKENYYLFKLKFK